MESMSGSEHQGTATEGVSMGHHAFAHPFFTHMGMPDGPGEVSVRTAAIQNAYNDNVSRDLALHIETGLWNHIGLHFRNDAIKANNYSEMMVQYAMLQNKHADSVISVFTELEFPTNHIPEGQDKVELEIGVSGRKIFSKYGILDAGVHYSPEESMVSLEASGVLRLTPTIFPIIETEIEKEGDEDTTANLLAGIKMRLRTGAHIGVGIRFPLTDARYYDNQAFAQLELAY